jgi:hypothetical protein
MLREEPIQVAESVATDCSPSALTGQIDLIA